MGLWHDGTSLLSTLSANIEAISAGATGLVALGALARRLVWRPTKELVAKFTRLIETNEAQNEALNWISAELRPNGGSSLRDAIMRIEGRVASAEGKVHALFAEMNVAAFEADANGACTYVTPAWSKLTGIQVHEALGNGWLNGVYPSEQESVFAAWQAAIQQHRPFNHTFRVGQFDEYVRVTATSRIIYTNHKISGFIGVLAPTDKLDTIEVVPCP